VRKERNDVIDPLWAPEYAAYQDMLRRCYDPTHPKYPDKGGRGIRVCDRWRFGEDGKSGFDCFLDDMGPIPDDEPCSMSRSQRKVRRK
jgi:hypothetical protein